MLRHEPLRKRLQLRAHSGATYLISRDHVPQVPCQNHQKLSGVASCCQKVRLQRQKNVVREHSQYKRHLRTNSTYRDVKECEAFIGLRVLQYPRSDEQDTRMRLHRHDSVLRSVTLHRVSLAVIRES